MSEVKPEPVPPSKKRTCRVLHYSPDKGRVIAEITRGGKRGTYLFVQGINSVAVVRPKGRAYIITGDKCNCPASRGQCKHVLVCAALKRRGYLPTVQWLKPKQPAPVARSCEHCPKDGGGCGVCKPTMPVKKTTPTPPKGTPKRESFELSERPGFDPHKDLTGFREYRDADGDVKYWEGSINGVPVTVFND